MIDIKSKIRKELEIYDNAVNVHDLPDIFHYWTNKYLRPIIEEFGITHPDDLYSKHIHQCVRKCQDANSSFVANILSIGAGNCDTEVRVAKALVDFGLDNFTIECLDLNPSMLARGEEMARDEGLEGYLIFREVDLNQWKAKESYIAVIANQSLHHIQNLEYVFDQVKRSLHFDGVFITSDMIGRNGHQRWPEALFAVHRFWRDLPSTHKNNHLLRRYEDPYENWDCSNEGFEGIRAQDILPLLIKEFHFELFIGFSNVIDIFIDRCFGHNFDINNQADIDFIDLVHEFDENAIRQGLIKPTHMMAVMRKTPVQHPKYSRGLSPEFCLRDPNI